MADLTTIMLPAAEGFYYDPAPQRTPAWYERRLGRVTASRLEDWLAVSRAKASLGKPLKKRLDYEKELLYERKFNVSYNNYISEAMLDGVALEAWAVRQYELETGNEVVAVGCWYNDAFVASPDGAVGEDGLVEAKVLRDASFADLLTGSVDKNGDHIPALSENGLHSKFWKQTQGQLWASGRKWVDFVAINTNTRKGYVTRILPDEEYHKWLDLSVRDEFHVDASIFDTSKVFDFKEALPELTESEFTFS